MGGEFMNKSINAELLLKQQFSIMDLRENVTETALKAGKEVYCSRQFDIIYHELERIEREIMNIVRNMYAEAIETEEVMNVVAAAVMYIETMELFTGTGGIMSMTLSEWLKENQPKRQYTAYDAYEEVKDWYVEKVYGEEEEVTEEMTEKAENQGKKWFYSYPVIILLNQEER